MKFLWLIANRSAQSNFKQYIFYVNCNSNLFRACHGPNFTTLRESTVATLQCVWLGRSGLNGRPSCGLDHQYRQWWAKVGGLQVLLEGGAQKRVPTHAAEYKVFFIPNSLSRGYRVFLPSSLTGIIYLCFNNAIFFFMNHSKFYFFRK